MTTITNPVNATNPNDQGNENNGKTRTVRNKELSKDDFMNVFLKQLQMQNPMKPYDSAAMLQQMSQLTSITATESLDKTVKSLNENIIQSQTMETTQLIGKKIQTPSRVAPLIKGSGVSGSVLVPKEASNVSVYIKDSSGKIVKTFAPGPAEKGMVDFNWDGKDGNGNELSGEFYQLEARATVGGKQTALITCGTYKVNSVAIDPKNGAVLNVDGNASVGMKDIVKIM